MWYFAYGSNMNKDRMTKRKINYTKRELGLLKGYKLVFNKTTSKGNFSFANITASEDTVVQGVLYEFPDEEIKILDEIEGVPNHYLKTTIEIVGPEAYKTEAVTYIANPKKIADGLLPTKEYLAHLLAGKDILSLEYYESLKQTPTVD